MEKNCKLAILVFVSCFFQFLNAQAQTAGTSSKEYHPVFCQLTEQDKHDYVLTAGQPHPVTRDTMIKKLAPGLFHVYQQKVEVLVIPVTLSNKSKDTLRYIAMSCSSWDSYQTDDLQITIIPPNTPCYKNGPDIITMLPYSSSTVNLRIAIPKKLGKGMVFKMGMILPKYVNKSQGLFFSRSQPGNVIWSDEIQAL